MSFEKFFKSLYFILSGVLLMSLLGCSSVKVQDYKNEKPIFKLEEYFQGTLEAHGIFQNRKGEIKKRFKCVIQAHWKGNVGTLDEDFTYSDGTKSRRVWTITKTSENTYKGTASDVIGEAQGEIAGNAFRWKYTLDLEVDGTHYKVKFDDWMYMMDEKVVLNRSFMSKFGIELGQVTLSFYKR